MTEAECQASMARNRDRIAAWRDQNRQDRIEAQRQAEHAAFWRAVDQRSITRPWTQAIAPLRKVG
jgi:hypothetical protein